MNILITGGVGFIGTNCAINFSRNEENHIVIVDDFSRFGVKLNAKFLDKNYPSIKIIKTDVNNISKYIRFIRTVDVILHLAGQTAVTTSIKNPSLDFRSNLLGSFRLLEAVRIYNPKAILLYSSTNKVYGELHSHQIKKNNILKRYVDVCHPNGLDETERLDFISPYGCSKGAADMYFLDYARIYGLKTVVFRQSCIYGPFQIGVEDQGWIAHFTKQFLAKKPITIYGNGFQVRDLLYIEDLIETFKSAIKNIAKVKGEAFNIGGGKYNSYSLLEVVKILEKQTKNKIRVDFKQPRLGDQKYFVASNKKINKMLRWQPKINFEKGVKKLIDWQRINL